MFKPKTGVSVLAASSAAVSCAADTNENTLASITVPPSALGINGILRITTQWTFTGSTNSKTWRVKFGSMSVQDNGTTSASVTSLRCMSEVRNVDAANSQKGSSYTLTVAGSVPATAPTTAAIDTTAAVTLLITGQKATAGETLTLDSYTVEIIRP